MEEVENYKLKQHFQILREIFQEFISTLSRACNLWFLSIASLGDDFRV